MGGFHPPPVPGVTKKPGTFRVKTYSLFKKSWSVIMLIPASPRAATGRRPVAAQASVSERGRSALFKNPLFFSGKFLGCYIEAAQNFIRYVTIFDRDRGQKTSLTKLVLKRSVLKQSLPNFQHKLL